MTENYSVLMSVYIKEKPEYLKEAITSILNQTVKTNDFVIVCDGPLTEGLNKVIADFVTTYSGLFNVYRLEHNMGLAKALNNGILQCKNEIIVRMDSDDVSMPDRVEKQMKAMKEKNADILICDTAGRLHNKKYLMDELNKIQKVINKEMPEADKEVLLVIDGATGQNAISQVKAFKQETDLTGLVITKLDGTAKGGVAIGIVAENNIPIKFIGVGEQIDDMEVFNSEDFVKAII